MNRNLSIHARLPELAILRGAVSEFIGTALGDTDRGRVILAIDEAVTNVIVHGYNSDESKTVDIEMISSPDSFTFIISDNAEKFNPLAAESPDIEQYHESGKSSGLGIDAYKRIMTVKYESIADGGNRLILIKEKKNENH